MQKCLFCHLTIEVCGFLKIRYGVVVVLLVFFTWWSTKSIQRYYSQPLTTDISYTFGDGIENGIQFPIITFCNYEDSSKNPFLKECNNGSWNVFDSFVNCLKNDKNFNIDFVMHSLQLERKMIIDEIHFWNGTWFNIDLEYMNHHVWSNVFEYQFGLCHSFDISNVEEYEFLPYNKASRPAFSFSFSQNIIWKKIGILLHSKDNFPDAWLLNGKTILTMFNDSQYDHRIEIQKKISNRISTRKSPCVKYEYNTCQNIKENKFVVDRFKCQIPILNFGQHLDNLIPNKMPNCSKNVTKTAINLLMNQKSECTKSQTCENKRYALTHKWEKGETNKTRLLLSFENPEVEYLNTYISYDMLSLIAEVGGTLGLTLGASIITLLETIFQRIPYY